SINFVVKNFDKAASIVNTYVLHRSSIRHVQLICRGVSTSNNYLRRRTAATVSSTVHQVSLGCRAVRGASNNTTHVYVNTTRPSQRYVTERVIFQSVRADELCLRRWTGWVPRPPALRPAARSGQDRVTRGALPRCALPRITPLVCDSVSGFVGVGLKSVIDVLRCCLLHFLRYPSRKHAHLVSVLGKPRGSSFLQKDTYLLLLLTIF
ncbi:unnamed protein product, partial [Amoebophrya sp. A120]